MTRCPARTPRSRGSGGRGGPAGWLRDPSPPPDPAQPGDPVREPGPLRGGRAAVPAGPGGPGAELGSLPPRRGHHAQHPGARVPVGAAAAGGRMGDVVGQKWGALLYSTGYPQGWGGRGWRSGETTETWAEESVWARDPQQSGAEAWGGRGLAATWACRDPVPDLGGVGTPRRDPRGMAPTPSSASSWPASVSPAQGPGLTPCPRGCSTETRTSTKRPQTCSTMPCRSGSRRWALSTLR